ncbi:hypothetical protein SK128_020778, partial [Halocaridina rubra]
RAAYRGKEVFCHIKGPKFSLVLSAILENKSSNLPYKKPDLKPVQWQKSGMTQINLSSNQLFSETKKGVCHIQEEEFKPLSQWQVSHIKEPVFKPASFRGEM